MTIIVCWIFGHFLGPKHSIKQIILKIWTLQHLEYGITKGSPSSSWSDAHHIIEARIMGFEVHVSCDFMHGRALWQQKRRFKITLLRGNESGWTWCSSSGSWHTLCEIFKPHGSGFFLLPCPTKVQSARGNHTRQLRVKQSKEEIGVLMVNHYSRWTFIFCKKSGHETLNSGYVKFVGHLQCFSIIFHSMCKTILKMFSTFLSPIIQ